MIYVQKVALPVAVQVYGAAAVPNDFVQILMEHTFNIGPVDRIEKTDYSDCKLVFLSKGI